MTRQEIAAKLAAAIAEEPRIFMAKPADSLVDSDRLGEDVGIDSVGRLYLVMAVEELFDLDVGDAEEVAEHFRTWGELLDWIEGAR